MNKKKFALIGTMLFIICVLFVFYGYYTPNKNESKIISCVNDLKENLKDPTSLQLDDKINIYYYNCNGKTYSYIVINYIAKNSFGSYVRDIVVYDTSGNYIGNEEDYNSQDNSNTTKDMLQFSYCFSNVKAYDIVEVKTDKVARLTKCEVY